MIPATAHFIWFGPQFHWIYGLALRSAALKGGFERVILHHADDLRATPGWAVLKDTPGVETRVLEPLAVLRGTPDLGASLADLYRKLERPASRANMVRAAILATQGGVYLDTDTVTVGDFQPLLRAGVFCGEERIVFPSRAIWSGKFWLLVRGYFLHRLRDRYRRQPDGWRGFRTIEHRYPRAVNNAVLGAEPEHPFIMDLLEGMVRMPKWRQTVRFALGTHLLQKKVAAYQGDDLVVHPPEVFYPLPPEISEHWFKETDQVRLEEALLADTRVVHWYGSVRTKELVPKVGPEYVRDLADSQLFSALALAFLDS